VDAILYDIATTDKLVAKEILPLIPSPMTLMS